MMIENNEYNAELGKFIREGREREKLTQKAIAGQLGICQSYYSLLERGERNWDSEMEYKICDILGINRQDFKYSKADSLIEKTSGIGSETSISEMLAGKIAAEKKSEGKSVSVYLTTDALKNLEKFAKANGCSKSKAADLILRNLY